MLNHFSKLFFLLWLFSPLLSAEVPPAGVVQLTRLSYTVGEGDGDLIIAVTRTEGSVGEISVEYVVIGENAEENQDFRAAGGVLMWADGDSATQTFPLSIIDDTILENTESVNVLLRNLTGGAGLGGITDAVVMIIDNDGQQIDPGSVQFAGTNFVVSESNAIATVVVTRTGGKHGPASVDYSTRPDTAGADTDYEPTAGRLSWEDGDDMPRTFTVNILNDRLAESVEGLRLVLENASGAVLGLIPEAVLTIHDDEHITTGFPGVLKFAAPAYQGQENGEIIAIEVLREGGNDGAVSVRLNTESALNTAVSEWDYKLLNGTLHWVHGDSEPKIAYISVLDDNLVENPEFVYLSLTEAVGAGLALPNTVQVTIGDNDIFTPGVPGDNGSGVPAAEYDEFTKIVTASRIDAGEWGVYRATLAIVANQPDVILEVRSVELLVSQSAQPYDVQYNPASGHAYVPAIQIGRGFYSVDLDLVNPGQNSWRLQVTQVKPIQD